MIEKRLLYRILGRRQLGVPLDTNQPGMDGQLDRFNGAIGSVSGHLQGISRSLDRLMVPGNRAAFGAGQHL